MKAMFVDPTSGGIDTEGIAANTRQPGNAYKRVNEAVKHVGRQGYSAGQVLVQVSLDRPPLKCAFHWVAHGGLTPPVRLRLFRHTLSSFSTEQLHDVIVPSALIPSIPKAQAALAIAHADYALCAGADEELQLMETCLRIQAAMIKGQ